MPAWTGDLPPIDRLSPHTSAAIRLAEHSHQGHHIRPDGTAEFLRRYRNFVHRPERNLRLVASEMPCCPGCQYDDIAVVRDALQEVMRVLPRQARIELRQLLANLDAEFRRRTLPDPDPEHWTDWSGTPDAWWHRRLYQGG
ncbi:hypothetical protein BCF44_1355 [Kutzneria buriramensis]|uniref:Uncharacterized protein n=1 Tax=Kutzneria buriramensis TaxID=1045776 RepID=A0A3E0GSI8_9PSEU|nr:hypothetical protein BCF44_1355 [Kutzneria buriramensis]